MKEWRIGTFKIIDTRVSFYSRGARLLPPGPESSFHTFEGGVQDFHMNYVLVLLGLLAVLWLFDNCIILILLGVGWLALVPVGCGLLWVGG